ncbi:hypothetical protein BDN72DRAFT_850409 [Pluteus cervinus]|uniref:Uncharacterized protein n=1 Tax=Pluteus cervinus TaxID=181527 RepID=A0ACD3A4H9_9AGAR|nr:hypothetical protein BDN72DRAFT_850409 [Pluteus cervinus]
MRLAPLHGRSQLLLDASSVTLTVLKETTPVFSQIAALALFIVEAVQSTRSNKEAYKSLVTDVVQLTHQVLHDFGVSEETVSPSEGLVPDKFQPFIQVLEEIKTFSTKRIRRRFWTRFLQNASDMEEVKVFRERLQHAMNVLGLRSHVSIHNMQDIIERILKQQVTLMDMIKQLNIQELSADRTTDSLPKDVVTLSPSELKPPTTTPLPSTQRNPFLPGFQSSPLPSPSSGVSFGSPSSVSSSSTLFNQNNPFNDYFSMPVHSSPVQTPATPPTSTSPPCCLNCRCEPRSCCTFGKHFTGYTPPTPEVSVTSASAPQTGPPSHLHEGEGRSAPLQPTFQLHLPSQPFPRRRSRPQSVPTTTVAPPTTASNPVRRSRSIRLEIMLTLSNDDQDSESDSLVSEGVAVEPTGTRP